MEPADVAREIATAARAMAEAPDEPVTAQTITERTAELIEDADAVSLTIRRRRRQFTTLAATAPLAAELDELQYELREGPCVTAAVTDDWFRSGDIGTDPRWPAWGPRGAQRGIASFLSVPLLARTAPIGALNFYAAAPARFGERTVVDLALLYATHAAIALSAARDVEGLSTALHSRHMIGIAQGILIERYGTSVEQSFELLRRHSNTLNIPLAEIAEQVVRTHRLPKV